MSQGKDPMADPWSEARVDKKSRVEKNLSNRCVLHAAGLLCFKERANGPSLHVAFTPNTRHTARSI